MVLSNQVLCLLYVLQYMRMRKQTFLCEMDITKELFFSFCLGWLFDCSRVASTFETCRYRAMV